MARQISVKLILELHESGMSQNAIASTRHISKHSVSDVLNIASEKGISFDDIKDMSPGEVYELFFPEKHTIDNLYAKPDYEYVHKELRKVGVTLKELWDEYQKSCRTENKLSMEYQRFCEGYRKFAVVNNLTNHLEHKPGVRIEVDWSGPVMHYIDSQTGELIKAYLFVAVLPYSQYTYVEACNDMKQNTWLMCHVHMFEYFGGTAARIICDNLKTGVISHPKEGDIILNEAYEDLGNHYAVAIMPAEVRRPKEKASVEGTVGKIATAVIAKLRNEKFYSLEELQRAVDKKIYDFNHKPFQKRDFSRYEVYLEEKAFLRPLPDNPYEICEWVYGRKVMLNSHISYKKNSYSCPYQFLGQKVDLKIIGRKLEIYHDGNRISSHLLFPEYVEYKYSTHKEDMPDRFNHPAWDQERIIKWAQSIGESTLEVIGKIFDSVKVKEQGYNPSLSILNLSKTYPQERLENACRIAMTRFRSPRYHHIKAILTSNQDVCNDIKKDDDTGYVRGADYYGGVDK